MQVHAAAFLLGTAFLLNTVTLNARTDENPSPQQQVWQAETAFAQSMANRDLQAFARFIAAEAVFFNGNNASTGREEIVSQWQGYFQGPEAPFSWAPEQVTVLASGTLAYSSGPVYNQQGERFATFNSVWRLEEDGHWRVVFDKGTPRCPAPATQ
ncbi:hypothetical protein GCM10009092_34610 [Bowmanella denitrificans]|uniref:DUF4440 domain-containing protein n=1 Tax=Bowmanella denitrificans TaxID=366582 RepID=A0ABN0XLJ8_9ALTE